MADSKMLPPSVSSPKSPPPNCAICLGSCSNKCYSDTCMHEFCFKCLLQWSKIKAECPLCKQPFKSIIHNVKSNQEYEEHIVTNLEPRYSPFDDMPDLLPLPNNVVPNARQHRFHFRTTFTVNTLGENAIQQMLLSPSLSNGIAIYNYVPSGWTYSGRRRRGDTSTTFRRSIYAHNLWANPPIDVTGRFREVTPQFFANNPTARTRLAPWLNRELNALLFENTQDVMHLFDTIMENLLRHHICSRTFRNILNPYLGQKTDHFIYEFYNFMKSPYDMIGYDRYVTYLEQPSSPTPMIDISDESSDSDVIIVGQSSNSNPVLIELLSDSDDDIIITSCPSYMMKKDKNEQVADRNGASTSGSAISHRRSSTKRRHREERSSSVSSVSSSSSSVSNHGTKKKEDCMRRKKKKQSHKHREKKRKSSSKSYNVNSGDSEMEDMPLSQYMKYLNKKEKEKRRKRKHKRKLSKSRIRKRDMAVQSENLTEPTASTSRTMTVDLSLTPPLPIERQRSNSTSVDWQILPPSPINITVTTSIHDDNSTSDNTIEIEPNRNSISQFSIPGPSSMFNETRLNIQRPLSSIDSDYSNRKVPVSSEYFFNAPNSVLENSSVTLDHFSNDLSAPSTSSYQPQSKNCPRNISTSSSEEINYTCRKPYLKSTQDVKSPCWESIFPNTDSRMSSSSIPHESYRNRVKNVKPESTEVIDLSVTMKTERPLNETNVMLNPQWGYSQDLTDSYRGNYYTQHDSIRYPFMASPSGSALEKPSEYWTDLALNDSASINYDDSLFLNYRSKCNYFSSKNYPLCLNTRTKPAFSDNSDSD